MLFDTSMKLSGITFDNLGLEGKGNDLFNYGALSNMAKKDLPSALNILSQLYIKGQLNTQTMQKMFTARHFMEISNLLLDINGNTDAFVIKLAKGVDYTDDFFKKMFDVNEQMKILSNNISNTAGSSNGLANKGMTGFLMALNGYLSEANMGIANFVTGIGSMGATFATASIGASLFMKTIAPLVLAKGSLIIGGVITGVLALVAGLSMRYAEVQKQTVDLNLNLNKNLLVNKQIAGELETRLNIEKMIKDTVDDGVASQGKTLTHIEASSTMMGALLAKHQDFKNLLDSIGETKSIGSDFLFTRTSDAESKLKDLETSFANITELQKVSMNGMYENIDTYIAKTSKEAKTDSSPESASHTEMKKIARGLSIEGAKKLKEELKRISEVGGSIKDVREELLKVGVRDTDIVRILGLGGVEAMNKSLSEFLKSKDLILSGLKEAKTEVADAFKALNDQISANNKAANMTISATNNLKLEAFEETTKYGGKEGIDGLFSLFDDARIQEMASNIETVAALRKSTEKEISLMKDVMASTKDEDITEEDRTALSNKEKDLIGLNRSYDELNGIKEQGLSFDSTSLELKYKDLELNSQNIGDLLKIYTLEEEILKLKSSDPGNTYQMELNRGYIDELKERLNRRLANPTGSSSSSGGKRKTGDSNYEMKYNNYIKENLNLELEIAKVMMTQGQQAMLTYKYKKEELKINKDLASHESAFAKARLAETGYKGGDITTAKGAQGALDSMYKTYGHTTKDDGVKNQFEALKVLTQALVKEEKLAVDIMLQPLTRFEDMLESLPNLIKDAYSSLSNGEGVLSIWNAESAKSMETDIINSLSKIKNSWTEGTGVNNISLFAGMNEGNIDQYLANSVGSVQIAQSDAQGALENRDNKIPLTAHEEELIRLLDVEMNKLEDIKKIKDKINDKDKANLDIALAKLNTYNKMGATISKLGSATGMKGLEDIGGVFSSFGDITKMFEDVSKSFSLKDIFNPKDMADLSDNFGKAMESALEGINFGATVGNMVGGMTGGGASAQAGGAVGGMIGSLGGGEALAGMAGMAGSAAATGGATLAISAAMSLAGSLFEDDGKDQEEAERKTKEANKAYDKNTDALNKLANNMSSLSGGIDGLNSTLISSFSKLPTFGNLTDVTGTLKSMYSTMEKTRAFNEVAYQVTKTKKGSSGFLGIGASADTSWTETISVSVQDMLNKYGFKGTIEDMTTDQMRSFSEWLGDYDMGDSDNFSILGDAIEDYAEALDKFDKNIENFFYDTTMESFAGISSLQQEELRQQIEDFYKDLGFQIDEEMSKTIDELAESMSVMVTIMQDVRGSFVDSWRDSGKTAGDAFLSSMTPYIDAMLENISQVFYDVYFSDVTSLLEDEFKALSEQLVELKKQGADLDWGSVAGSLSGSFDKVISSIIVAQTETENFNDIVLALQAQALEAGMTLSELLELGLVSGSQKSVIESFKSAMLSSESEGALDAIGQLVGDKVGNAIADKLIDNMLSDKILQFSANMDKIVNGNLSFDSLAGLANEALGVGMMLDEQRQRLEAIKSMFDFNGDINYESQESNVDYSSGTSSNIVNNYFLTASLEAGNVIESDSIDRLTDSLLDSIIEKLRVDRGIDITKNY